MNLKKFKRLTKLYSDSPVNGETLSSKEYNEYLDAFHDNKECQEWELKRRVKNAGMNYQKYCCIHMAYHLIEDKKSKKEGAINYDSVVTHTYGRKEFGIPIHDGGTSFIQINYCPWCGEKLPGN